MLAAVLVSLAVVFVAELGDKSQLITMTYALRHRWWVVLSGVGLAAMLVHGLSVTIGHFLGLTLPERPIAFAAAIAFLLFAVWTWREGRADGDADGEDEVRVAEPRFVILAIISSFVLAELGDKTMLATVALASDRDPWGVWIGATIGMVLADGVAIVVGAMLHKRLPEGFLHAMASVLFLLFGLWMLFDAALGWRTVAVVVTGGATAVVAAVTITRYVRARRGRGAPTTERDPSPEPA
ncbi:TMEM165/GDT1 family protein [Mycobacterium sp. WMMD1722]|uniref:TMEM165/GDT1 family protein n=1 Tax=Mycobacterium sp. WMMD1722 TaxID=3404117 RepID=UPI003BF46718